jgi:alkanesulfonate monooxygenase SsuD/methylene tetrahydromethanopterin reductase-like flavin-dependent oxidoreductase (luciferase family)
MAEKQYNPPLFGLNIDPSAKNLQLAYKLAQLGDSSGMNFLSIQDHPYNGNFFDTWTLLTFLGAQTQQVRLLPNVINLPLRPPAVLAKAAATLDILTNGRLELGLGAGAMWEGIVAYGGTERTPGAAVSALEEAIEVMRLLWQPISPKQTVHFSGQHYSLVNAHPGPTPTHPIGIWLGALRPRMLRLTGQKADGLLISAPYIPPENVPDIQQAVDKAAQEAGRDTRAIRRAYNLMGAIVQGNGPTITPTRKGVIVGTARQWVDELVRYYYDLRMDTFIFWPVMGDEETQARIFVEEVVPEVKAHIAG